MGHIKSVHCLSFELLLTLITNAIKAAELTAAFKPINQPTNYYENLKYTPCKNQYSKLVCNQNQPFFQ
jgi:hypothetical protein